MIVRITRLTLLKGERISGIRTAPLFLKGGRFLLTMGVALLCFTDGRANPTGGTVRHGGATIVQEGDQVIINQTTGMAILDWHSFSIAQGETTKFVQPNSSSMALNRVNGGTQSLINGRLEANGGIILINPAGIVVGKSGVINVNSFIASTHDVTDEDFLSGKAMKFQGSSEASIQNLGTIHAESGDIFLIAHSVINEGTLSAKNGTVGLVAANEVLLRPDGDEKLSILSKDASSGKISHRGTIEAVSAEIKAAGNPYAVAINLDGLIQAKGVSEKKARVIVKAEQGDIQMSKAAKIDAGGDTEGGKVIVQTKGNLEIAGTVLATSATGNGGEVQLLGDNIHLGPTAAVDASGFAGGGNIFVGGDYQGGNNADVHYSSTPLPNAQTLLVEQGAQLMANATGNGNGGVIIQWSDETTVSSGSVSVQGGPLEGNGGFTEISGKQNLGFNGTVDLAAPNGIAGTVLFDPSTLYIHDGANPRDQRMLPLDLSGLSDNYWLSTAAINSVSSGMVRLRADNIYLWDADNKNPAHIDLAPNVSLEIYATSGDLYIPADSSIKLYGDAQMWLTAYRNLTLGGEISQDKRNIALETKTGDIFLDSKSKIESTTGSIILESRLGRIYGTSELSVKSGYVTLIALNDLDFSGAIRAPGKVVLRSTSGDLTLNGSVQSGNIQILAPGDVIINSSITANGYFSIGQGDYWWDPCPNKVTLNGSITADNYITLVAGNSLTLGNLLPTSLNAQRYIDLSSTSMNLKAAFFTTTPNNIDFSGLSGLRPIQGNITLAFQNGLSTFSSSLQQIVAQLSANSSLTIQAPQITLSDTEIRLNRDVSLGLFSSGSASLPGTLNLTGDTIITQGNGIISLTGNGNVSLSDTSVTADQGTITIASLTGNLNLAAQIASEQSGSAVGLSAGGNFNASANASISTPNGRWVIYSTDPALNSVLSPSLQSGNAIYAKTATSLPPSSVPPSGNYYVYSAPIVATTLAPPASTPSATALNTVVTTLVSSPSFMRMASAVMGPPPAVGGMGPAGPSMGGGFGGMGPSGGMGGFSSGGSFGGPAPSSAPAPSGPGGGGEMAGGPSGSGGPSPAAGPGGEGAAPPPPGSEGSPGAPGGESEAAPSSSGAPVAGGPGGEAAPGAPAPAAPGAPSSSGSSAGAGGAVASAGAPGGAGLAGTAASAPHLPASIAAVNTMNNPIPSSVGQAHSLNAFSAAADHGGVESGGSSSAAAGASGSGKSQSSAGGRSGTMGFGSDPETAESVNSTITTLMMVL